MPGSSLIQIFLRRLKSTETGLWWHMDDKTPKWVNKCSAWVERSEKTSFFTNKGRLAPVLLIYSVTTPNRCVTRICQNRTFSSQLPWKANQGQCSRANALLLSAGSRSPRVSNKAWFGLAASWFAPNVLLTIIVSHNRICSMQSNVERNGRPS